jgi:glyoxylase-like metal-dependent hydrolase (beta-lactamase superfamily II)
VTPDQEVRPQLRALGHPPQSVAKVVMIHMHSDHAGGLAHFEGVEILMTEREAAMALGPNGAISAYFKKNYPKWSGRAPSPSTATRGRRSTPRSR